MDNSTLKGRVIKGCRAASKLLTDSVDCSYIPGDRWPARPSRSQQSRRKIMRSGISKYPLWVIALLAGGTAGLAQTQSTSPSQTQSTPTTQAPSTSGAQTQTTPTAQAPSTSAAQTPGAGGQ